MRQKESRHIIVHIGMGFRELKIGHFFSHFHHIPANPVGQRAHPCTHQRPIADKSHPGWIHFRQKANGHGFFQIHITAESPCQDDAIQVLYHQSDFFQKGQAPTVNSAFSTNQVVNIRL